MNPGTEPVFIVGMNGSGTSMMLDSLGRHPQLYAIPYETLMMPYVIAQAQRFGDLNVDNNFNAYWQFAITAIPVLSRIDGEDPVTLPDTWRSQPRSVDGVLAGIFGSLAARQGKRRWCEKTPDHVQHLPLLSQTFPEAKFVHLIRDGREVACSVHRRQMRTPDLVIYRWKNLVRLGQSDGQLLGNRYLEVRYESLTSGPEAEMQRVCDFLGVPFAKDVLLSRMPQNPARKSLGRGELRTIAANPEKWRDYFDIATIRRLESIAGEALLSLGYPIMTKAGDSDPNWLSQRYWRATDFVRHTMKLRKTTKRYDSWSKLARNVLNSYKEYRRKKY